MASFVQTCKGGSIGREGNHDVLLDDIACSKTHAQITFDEKEAKYFIVDIGSSNGNDVFASPMHLAQYFVFYKSGNFTSHHSFQKYFVKTH